jgi:hypothetical protein
MLRLRTQAGVRPRHKSYHVRHREHITLNETIDMVRANSSREDRDRSGAIDIGPSSSAFYKTRYGRDYANCTCHTGRRFFPRIDNGNSCPIVPYFFPSRYPPGKSHLSPRFVLSFGREGCKAGSKEEVAFYLHRHNFLLAPPRSFQTLEVASEGKILFGSKKKIECSVALSSNPCLFQRRARVE